MRIPKGTTHTISATGTVELGDASSEVMGTIVVHLVTANFDGTVAPQARVKGVTDDADYMDVAYRTASNENIVSAGSDITMNGDADNRIIEINAGGRQVRLDVTRTSGSLEVTFWPLLG